MSSILEVKDLKVSFKTYAGEVKAVRGVSFDLKKGETLAIVGESGCGKTVTAKAILRLLKEPPAIIKEGSQIIFNGENVLKMNKKRLQHFRGGDISMIFQDPMTSLNPTMTIGNQIAESLIIHKKIKKKQAINEAIRLLEIVNIPNAKERIKSYPHQLSGGMRQRVMIAIALSCSPKILIADEPTTALDVTIQAQIIELLNELKREFNTSVVIVTHDLGVVANFADRVQVMYAGHVIETGNKYEIFYESKHPYTWALLNSVPRLDIECKAELHPLKGTPPDLILPLEGCPFASRCEYAMEICLEKKPEETSITDSHRVSCWLQDPRAPKVERPINLGGTTNE
ncbi:ABC transporter ATP-binding protein [Alkaliphilus peptidifermentans]|uniref:Oligopeptide transport system ATP-binding protein n=1 Tax=Alkaliphilus peptidifermentans DSM 18978 TaxID=1120976 RepID=A0A1G5AYB3_9FIRM|nr:ABC transporter ATP-binding protein [Alkaliphilus peptidifermentans]SCX82831.1 oligopeptide transport system ATP-binding protein [Alkaliphilus peptidifermentans DSM 18978]